MVVQTNHVNRENASENNKVNEFRRHETWKFWQKRRYVLAILAFFGFFNVYSLRANLSIAIVAMIQDRYITLENGTEQNLGPEFDWGSEIKGYVLSSFFYGYITTQLIGGYIGAKFGGKIVFGTGIAATALLSLFTPMAAAYSVYLLLIVRISEGIFEGVTYPSLHAIWARWTPPLERNRITMIAYSGSYVGNVVAMPLSAYLSEAFGWKSIFYFFGVFALAWYIIWMWIVTDSPEQDSRITQSELLYIQESLRDTNCDGSLKKSVPWKSILTSKAVMAIAVANFSETWGFYTLLTQLPMYLNDIYKYDLGKSGFLSSLPYIAMAIMIQFSGYLSDWLLSKNILSRLSVRRIFNGFGFIAQTVCMTCVAIWSNDVATVALLTVSVGSGAFALAGFVVNPLDIAPRYASIVLGISNTFGTLPGIVSPILSGYIVSDNPTVEEWRIVFFIASGIYLFGAVIYIAFSSADLQDWAIVEEFTEDQQGKFEKDT